MEVHYRVTGSGPPLLLLHGTASSLHTWDPWVSHLSSHFRLIRVDLPGFGLTGPDPRDRYHLNNYVDFLESFREHLDLDSFHLAGNSFGGKLSYSYTLEYPDPVRKLILIDSMGFMKRWPSLFFLPTIPVLGRVVRSLSPRWLINHFVRSLYGDERRLTERRLEQYYDLFLAAGNRRALHKRLNTDVVSNHKQLRELTKPTLIQWGTDDPLLPARHANYFGKRLRNSSVITYLGAGHVPMEEIPEQTARDAGRFLTD